MAKAGCRGLWLVFFNAIMLLRMYAAAAAAAYVMLLRMTCIWHALGMFFFTM